MRRVVEMFYFVFINNYIPINYILTSVTGRQGENLTAKI